MKRKANLSKTISARIGLRARFVYHFRSFLVIIFIFLLPKKPLFTTLMILKMHQNFNFFFNKTKKWVNNWLTHTESTGPKLRRLEALPMGA